jgi:hypothetical protein
VKAGGKQLEATFFSETLVDIQWTTWRYIPEDSTLQGMNLFIYFYTKYFHGTYNIFNVHVLPLKRAQRQHISRKV